jgi:hypothetical protein
LDRLGAKLDGRLSSRFEKLRIRKNMRYKWVFFLLVLILIGCYSHKNKTEERAKQRVTEFVKLLLTKQWDKAEGYLSRELADSENKELLFSNFDTPELQDTSKVTIEVQEIYIPENDPKQRAIASVSIRNTENNHTKMASMPIRYERGDWYVGT